MPGLINITNVSIENLTSITNVSSVSEFFINVNTDIYSGMLFFIMLWVLWVIFIIRSGLNEQEVHAIMATQISRQKRLELADDVIVNNMEIFHLQKSVGILHRKYLGLLKEY